MVDREKKVACEEELEMMRHSAAHVMAEAVQSIFPEAKFDNSDYSTHATRSDPIPQDCLLSISKLYKFLSV